MRKSTADAAWMKAAQIIFLILPCVWGVDYLSGPPKKALYVVEQYLPTTQMGVLLIILGMMGLIGEWWRELGKSKPPQEASVRYLCQPENRWWWSFTAHVGLCGIYMGLGMGCVMELIVNNHFYGIKVAYGLFAVATAHLVFAHRSRYVD